MTRRIAAVVFLLVVSPALLRAQETALTVSVPSADVHKGPSTVTPVIGHAVRGTVLPVSRNLGSWVKVPWPSAPDGVGYVHVTMGKIDPPPARTVTSAAPRTSAAAVSLPPLPTFPSTPPAAVSTHPDDQIVAPRAGNVMRPTHIVGIGALVASPNTLGGTARVWPGKHLAIQLGMTNEIISSDVAAGRVTSLQFEPGVMYVPVDHISDYLWFRPYVGSAVSFRRQTLRVAGVDAWSDKDIGYRIFGGSELTFASLPRLGLSVEVTYRRFPTVFADFEPERLSASIAGHWYIK